MIEKRSDFSHLGHPKTRVKPIWGSSSLWTLLSRGVTRCGGKEYCAMMLTTRGEMKREGKEGGKFERENLKKQKKKWVE